MPPFKALPKSETAAKEQGLVTIMNFFSQKAAPGRPAKKTSKAGRPAQKRSALLAEVPIAAAVAPKAKKIKATRQNWSKGEGLKRMSDAVAEWKVELAKPEKNRDSVHLFSEKRGIPYTTFQDHIAKDEKKLIKLGSGVGRKPLISSKTQEVIVDVLVRKDRANQGLGVGGAIDMIEQMHPDLRREQIDRCFRRTVRPAFKERLTNPVAAQATTTKRTAVTVQQQWRWHKCMDDVFAELLRRNECPANGGGGVSFRELMSHFILASDEACLLASGGTAKVLGEKGKQKHEKILHDSRVSITIVRCAAAGGATGPTNFCLEGTKVKPGYTSDFLQRHGAAPGSSIVMTPTAFMTEQAWVEMAEVRAKGMRSMPVIKDHPEYWLVEVLDGYAAHFSSPIALDIYYKHKILQVKEEGDTSQLCQLYDQDPAKKDKGALYSGNDMLRQAASSTKGVIDQYGLVNVALMAVRQGNSNPQMWINAAKKVNLHPDFRRPFSTWLEEKRSFLEGGKGFKMESYSTDVYPLLWPIWHAMVPAEKKHVMEIVERNGGYNPKCLHELYTEVHVLYKDMQKLRLCVEAAKENPDHLEMGMPVEDPVGTVAPDLAEAVAAQPPVTQGLATFQLKPPGLSGSALFAHMVEFRARHSSQGKPSPFLDAEITQEQEGILAPTIHDLSVSAILKDAGGEGATKKLAQRKLNNTGAITSHCGLQNHPARVKRLLSALELTASLAEIAALSKANKDKDKRKADTELMDLAPVALVKLNNQKNQGDVTKLTKKEICAISFRFFGTMYKEANPKPVLVSGLEGLIEAQPTVLAAAAAAGVPAPAPVVAPTPAGAAAAESNSDEEYEEVE